MIQVSIRPVLSFILWPLAHRQHWHLDNTEYSHLAWTNTKREEGGLGPDLKLKLVADKNLKIARDYGVLLEVRVTTSWRDLSGE